MGMARRAVALSAIFCLPPLLMGQEFYLRPSDHVVYYGDSDSAGRGCASLIETFILTRFPHYHISFTNITNDQDFDPSSLATQPTVIVATAADANSKAFRAFLEKVRASSPQARLTILETAASPAERGAQILSVNVFESLAAAAEKARAIDSALAATTLSSGVPRGPAGPLLIANALLQAWRAPALVSSVEIDALRGSVTRAENTTVREFENGRVIAWTEDDEALPVAVDIMDPSVVLAIQSSDFGRRLDDQTLRVRGMAAERYSFTIDGTLIGIFHRDQLDAGLNLALLRTPMWKQAMAVLALTRKHEELRQSRRHLFDTPPEQRKSDDWRAALEALDTAEAELVNEQQKKAKAGTHDYELQPVER
jgi:hypothetical protein